MSDRTIEPGLAKQLSELLETRSFGRAARWYGSVQSTNSEAATWAAEGAPEGAVVVAEKQTAGRGRFDRTWEARRGENLTFSIILFPEIKTDCIGMIPIAFSVAVSDTIREAIPDRTVEVKWPNDVLLDGRKVCGMLQESALAPTGALKRVVVGIGLNVNQTAFADELRSTATSLKSVANQPFDRIALLARLLSAMEHSYYSLQTGNETTFRSRYEANLNSIGREVTFVKHSDMQNRKGIVTGIDERGGLIVMTPAGRETIFAGEVSMTPPQKLEASD
jgi:BirA family biotin operon repressor/biotin-[acetyl-CoA-carboxylase] ligase